MITMRMRTRAKDKIAARQPVIAINAGGVALEAVDLLGGMGLDVLFIDCERTAIGLESVGPMARAAQAHGAAAVVRSHSAHPEDLVRYLDRKIDGIVLPKVESADQAAMLVDTVRYACGKQAGDKIVIAQIESVEGVRRLSDIAAVPGIDLFLLGPNDLSHSMGFAGDLTQPDLMATIDQLASDLRARGCAFGLPVRAEQMREWIDKGATFLYHPLEWLVRPAFSRLMGDLSALTH
jgi:2-keto-3-deoxy-L-rhamnonate aldolase RhmA